MNLCQQSFLPGRVLVWFSCGAASALAAKLAAEKYEDKVELIYCNTAKDEHSDNVRFRADVERWVGLPVKVIGSKLYQTTDEVFEATRYMAGIGGARCTTELKKLPRRAYSWAEDKHIFGMTADEPGRIAQLEGENPELYFDWILRDAGKTKADCLRAVAEAGIELPMMYRLGFDHNNCIGCVKATSPAYWNLTRKHFPERFRQRAEPKDRRETLPTERRTNLLGSTARRGSGADKRRPELRAAMRWRSDGEPLINRDFYLIM